MMHKWGPDDAAPAGRGAVDELPCRPLLAGVACLYWHGDQKPRDAENAEAYLRAFRVKNHIKTIVFCNI